MNSLRRWLYRPKRSDPSLLAQFYFADEELNLIAAELDGFEGRKDPERCAALVNQLRACQARVLNIVSQIMDESIKEQRALRDFRVKFPDDVIQENLAGQLWFGAECLAAGSSIMNREVESACMRPLARALTKNLDSLRTILREQCLHNVDEYTDLIKENLIIFDKLFAEFELSYVSAMVSVKTAHEYDMIQEITVLFSETVQRALCLGLLTQEMIDEYDPALMFTIPRLAIICGVLIFNDGPLNPDNDPWNISEMFRPFQTLLLKIRELLSILSPGELNTLERALCSQDEPSFLLSLEEKKKQAREERRKYKKERKGSGKAKDNKESSEGDNGSVESELTAKEIAERLEALALSFEASHSNCENKTGVDDSAEKSISACDPKNEEPSSSSVPDCDINPEILNSSSTQELQSTFHGIENVYQEVTLNSSEVFSNPASAFPGRDLLIQSLQMPSHFSSNNLIRSDMDNDENSFAEGEDTANHDEELNDGNQFLLNKCDSKDSGLQSEVVSNSGSMFTISSSDSNQQILSSDSVPTASDQNCTDSSEDGDSNDLTADNVNPYTQLENSSDSSATIVSMKGIADAAHPDTKLVRGEAHEIASKEKLLLHADMGQDFTELGPPETPIISCIPEDKESTPSIHTDDSVIRHENCNNLDVHCVSNSVQSLPQELHNPSAETEPVSHNHSSNVACGRQLELGAVCQQLSNGGDVDVNCDNDQTPCDNIQTLSESKSCPQSHSDVSSKDLSCSNEMETNSDLTIPNANPKEEPVASKDQVLSTSPTVKCSNPNLNKRVDNPTADMLIAGSNRNPPQVESYIPTSVQNGDAHQTTSSRENEVNNSEPTPVNSVQSDHKSGASTVKSKLTSKRNMKNYGKKPRRQGSGPSHSRDSKPVLCPHHAKMLLESHQQLDSDRYHSSDTSSYTSECGDQEEIALALEAAESATRNQVRARFRSSSDMIHRLFVCISGVADQLQTNFAGDLRNILRCVFDMNCPEPMDMLENDKAKDSTPLGAAYRAMSHASRAPRHRHSSLRRDPPTWLPDEQSNDCMACQVPFNFLRRRHHCRNCGKIFCSRCSSNFVPLPHFGQENAVRVCNRCFMFQVTPFTSE